MCPGNIPDSLSAIPSHPKQMDNHNGNLSVEETLLYAFACQAGMHGTPRDLSHEIGKKLAAAGGGSGSGSTSEVFQEALKEVSLTLHSLASQHTSVFLLSWAPF